MSLVGKAEAGAKLRGKINALEAIRGYSAYEVALMNGFKGTEEEWLQSLEANPERIQQYVNEYLAENPVAIDETLSISGQAADAKKTGDAIAALRKTNEDVVNTHVSNKENPHNVTKSQVGLDKVDNTSDMDKPVSTAQGEAIRSAKDEALKVANSAQKAHIAISVTLPASGWSNDSQTVAADGVTSNNTLIVASAPENYDAYAEAGIYCSSQANGYMTFKCKDAPSVNLNVNIMILN